MKLSIIKRLLLVGVRSVVNSKKQLTRILHPFCMCSTFLIVTDWVIGLSGHNSPKRQTLTFPKGLLLVHAIITCRLMGRQTVQSTSFDHIHCQFQTTTVHPPNSICVLSNCVCTVKIYPSDDYCWTSWSYEVVITFPLSSKQLSKNSRSFDRWKKENRWVMWIEFDFPFRWSV